MINRAPSAEATNNDDLLARHLSGLFSDVVLTDMIRPVERQRTVSATGVAPPIASAPIALDEGQRTRPGPLERPHRLVISLATVIVFSAVILLPLLRGRLARSAFPGTSFSTEKTTVASAIRPTLAPPSQPPSSTKPATTVNILPVVRAGPLLIATPASMTTTPVSTRVSPAPAFEPGSTADTASLAEPTSTARPSPTATSAQTPQPTSTVANTPLPSSTPNAADSTPSRLVIPNIDLDAPIITVGFENLIIDGHMVTTWSVPERFAVGWHHTSAPPGTTGNTVLNGHQNIYSAVFRDLNQVQLDDEIIVYAGNTAHYYHVTERHILEEEGQPLEVRIANASWILPTDDERLTLVTCAPDSNSTRRLIIVALPRRAAPTPGPSLR